MARTLRYSQYTNQEELNAAFDREWLEWFSNFPEVALLDPDEKEKFKVFARKIIYHVNGLN